MAIVHESARMTPMTIARTIGHVPKLAEVTPVVIAETTGLQNAETLAGSATGQGRSGRACRFRTTQ